MTGEIKVILMNFGHEDFVITPSMRIAQMVFASFIQCDMIYEDDLSNTERNEGLDLPDCNYFFAFLVYHDVVFLGMHDKRTALVYTRSGHWISGLRHYQYCADKAVCEQNYH